MKYLVLGADGYIGAYIYEHLKQDGYDVLGTSRRDSSSNKYLYFDILKSNIKEFAETHNTKNGLAIFCIADSNIASCHDNYSAAYSINVIKTKELIGNLIQNGYSIIFFSSDNVFDGCKGNYSEHDARNPINWYGQMKVEMEDYITGSESGTIFRISKVVSSFYSNHNIFSEWEKQNQNNQCIRCIKGNVLSFTWMDDIYRLCLLAGSRKIKGLYNLCGDKPYSRKELADLFFRIRGDQSVEIVENDLNTFDLIDGRPLNVSMDNFKIVHATGFRFTSMQEMIEQYLLDSKMEKMED